MSGEQPSINAPSKILVIKLSSLGDLFHALPAVHNLRLGLGAGIDWVTQTNYADVVRCFQDVDRVIAFPRRGFAGRFRAFLGELRQQEYDLIVDLQGLLKSAFVGRLARGRRRIGPSFHREGSRLLYPEVAGPRDKNRHAVDEALDIVRYLNLQLLPPAFPVAFPKMNLAEPGPRVAIVPCSRWVTKNWPPAKFIETARGLQQKTGAWIYLVGGPEDQATCSDIATQLGSRVTNLCGKTSLVALGSLLQEMDVVVSVDSGPMHVAAALGRPVVAVFGATDPVRTGPYGAAHRVLCLEGLDCRPCYSDWCKRKDLKCLHDLSPGRVIEAAVRTLEQKKGPP